MPIIPEKTTKKVELDAVVTIAKGTEDKEEVKKTLQGYLKELEAERGAGVSVITRAELDAQNIDPNKVEENTNVLPEKVKKDNEVVLVKADAGKEEEAVVENTEASLSADQVKESVEQHKDLFSDEVVSELKSLLDEGNVDQAIAKMEEVADKDTAEQIDIIDVENVETVQEEGEDVTQDGESETTDETESVDESTEAEEVVEESEVVQ